MSADSFIRRHKAKWANNKSVSPVAHVPMMDDKDRLMLVGLESDLSRLSDIQSHQKRDEVKRDELLGRYREYLKQLLIDANPRTPEVVFWNMCWAIDAGDVEWAITLGKFAIQHEIDTPERFRRDIRNTFTGDLSRLALQRQKKGESAPFILDVLSLTNDWDLLDEISADLWKAAATEYETAADYQQALHYYQKASDAHPRARVQRAIMRMQKQIDSAK